MNIGIFGTLAFKDDIGMNAYLGMHEIQHSLLADTVANLSGIPIDQYPLGSMADDKDWMLNHDQIHRSINAALRIDAPADLQDYDLTDEQDFYDWQAAHNAEHDKLGSLLGV